MLFKIHYAKERIRKAPQDEAKERMAKRKQHLQNLQKIAQYYVNKVTLYDDEDVKMDLVIKVKVGDNQLQLLRALVDLGAEVNTIPMEVYKQISQEPLESAQATISGIIGNPVVAVAGKTILQIQINGSSYPHKFFVLLERCSKRDIF